MFQSSFVSFVALIIVAGCSAEPGNTRSEASLAQIEQAGFGSVANTSDEASYDAVDNFLLTDPDNGGGKGTCKHVCSRACVDSCKAAGGSAAECRGDCCDEVCK